MTDFKWKPVGDDRVRCYRHEPSKLVWERVEPPVEINTFLGRLAIRSKEEAEEAFRIGMICEGSRDKAIKFFEELEQK